VGGGKRERVCVCVCVCVCVSRILIFSCRFFSSSSRDLGFWFVEELSVFSCCSKEPELVFGLQCVCVCVRCLGFGFVGFVGFFVGCCWQQKASSDGGRYTRRASALGVQQHGVPTAGLVE
jgi:hypothetical protein